MATRAQIVNGSFSNGTLSGWTVLGTPSVDTSNAPTPGAYDALIQSTGDDPNENTDSVPTTTIAAAFGLTDLPSTSGLGVVNNQLTNITTPPVNGQAIYQTFTLATTTTITFSTSYFTNDFNPYDSAGYLLEKGSAAGSYTELSTILPTSAPLPARPRPTSRPRLR